MPQQPFRFIHASDFHLESPVQGLSEVPDHLREALVDAAYVAAAPVFDTVLAEGAHFLVLAGDILQAQVAGLRGPLFLVEQFSRLSERGMPVYWAGGEVDPPEAWPTSFPLPENVHVFPRGRAAAFEYQRDSAPVARLIGQSRSGSQSVRPGDFAPDPAGLFSIAVAHGPTETAAMQSRGVHYWALGGRHDRVTPLTSSPVAHYSGTCQGRRPEEAGAHGCTLVEVDDQRQARTSFLATDSVRWISERVAVDETTSRENLESLLRERVHALIETTAKMDILLSWTVAGSGPLMTQLRRRGLGGELLGWLRNQYGMTRPAAWSVSLEAEPAVSVPPEWYEQDTIRGDFLRAVRELEMNPEEPLELETLMADAHLAGITAAAAAIPDKAVRQRVLRDAALLGVDLLSGEGP